MRVFKSHPLLKLLNDFLIDSSQPLNLSFAWNFGSLLAVSLIIQIVTGVTLAIHLDLLAEYSVHVNFVEYYNNIIGVTLVSSLKDIKVSKGDEINKIILNNLKKKILTLKYKNININDEFCEWLRGFTDAEGYFLIQANSRKVVNSSDEIVTYYNFNFRYIIHLSIKDKDVLYIIQENLGGIGQVIVNEKNKDVSFIVSNKDDLEKLIEIMCNYFNNLNTVKLLDFLAWNEAREIYYEYTGKTEIPKHKDLAFTNVYKKIISLKNACNKSRINYILPIDHKVTITKYWLLGFIEGEGCFSYHDNGIYFSLNQTIVNRYVLVAIKDFLINYAGKSNLTLTIADCKPNKTNQKPYSVLSVGRNYTCAKTLISVLIDLSWLSLKRLDFIDWVIIYLLLAEGKHYLNVGLNTITSLRSRMNLRRVYNKLEIDDKLKDLLFSDSNFIETEQTGVLKVIESSHRNKKIQIIDSYVLVANVENSVSFGFRSNAVCALYFSVSKVTIGRWISRNSSVVTKLGTFIFKKVIKHHE